MSCASGSTLPFVVPAFDKCASTTCGTSFASNLLAAGVDVVTVSKALGHASPHITMTIYAHALPNARRGTADKMAQLMEESDNETDSLDTNGADAA